MASKLPALFDCGCSHLKVSSGRCSVYNPRGELREPTTAASVLDSDTDLVVRGPGQHPERDGADQCAHQNANGWRCIDDAEHSGDHTLPTGEAT